MDLTVARAVFTSALIRSDPPAPEIKRDDAALFTKSLLKTLNICTAAEVKACKDFIVRNITPSATRTAALSKYLLVLSKTCQPRNPGLNIDTKKLSDENEGLGSTVDGKAQQPPSAAFRRLHILYVVHDVLCFLIVRGKDAAHLKHVVLSDAALSNLMANAGLLAQLASCSDGKSRSISTLEPVRSVIGFWEKLNVYSDDQCAELRSACEAASTTPWTDLEQKLATQEAQAALAELRRKGEETKWIMPRQHHLPHDPNAPWHELPAANGLYQKRNEGFPLRAKRFPPGGYRLRSGGQQADESLKQDVAELYKEALRCFDKYTDAADVQDIDPLGNMLWKDRPTRNYWGLTYEGIARRAGAD